MLQYVPEALLLVVLFLVALFVWVMSDNARKWIVLIAVALVVVGIGVYVSHNTRVENTALRANKAEVEKQNLKLSLANAELGVIDNGIRAEIKAWRDAAEPAWDLYHRQLDYTGRGKVDLTVEGRPADLALALRPCEVKAKNQVPPVCPALKIRGQKVQIYIGVLDTISRPVMDELGPILPGIR